jgi:hypothetical protein
MPVHARRGPEVAAQAMRRLELPYDTNGKHQ